MSADVVPVRMRNEDRRKRRKPRGIRPQRLIGSLRGVRPCSCVDADQLTPIVRDHEIVFLELESGEYVYTPRDYLGNAPRHESMSRRLIFRERTIQRNRAVEVLVPASLQILLRLSLFSAGVRELSKAVVRFPQPARLRRFVSVLDAPGEFVLRYLVLMEEAGKLCVNHARNPVHNEHLPAGKLLGLFQYGDRLFHITHSTQQWYRLRMLRAQQTDGAQIQRFLRVYETWPEFFQPRRKELRTFALQLGIRVLRHQEKQDLGILRRPHAVDGFEILEFRTRRTGNGEFPGNRAGGRFPQAEKQDSGQQQCSR